MQGSMLLARLPRISHDSEAHGPRPLQRAGFIFRGKCGFQLAIALAAAVVGLAAGSAWAGYTLTTLASLNQATGYPYEPMGGVIVSGNVLYGTTVEGGAYGGYGAVFSVPIGGGTPTVLASLNGTDGSAPEGNLILSGNALYGAARGGGANGSGFGYGCVFSVPISGGTPTVLGSLNLSVGANPAAGLVLSGSILYGTATSGVGTVFSVPLGGGTPALRTMFSGATGTPAFPEGNLMVSGSTLYGTSAGGGANSWGTVFSLPLAGGGPTVLASFAGLNGEYAAGPLVRSGNTLYGTTMLGGPGFNGTQYSGYGTVFSVPVTGGAPTVLASFNGANGYEPQTGVVIVGNTLYGTTQSGGAYNEGTIFSVPITGGTPTVLASFNGANGEYPYSGLTLSGHMLYGTTAYGGVGYGGIVYGLDLSKPTAIVSLTDAVPSAFGAQVGTFGLIGGHGHYQIASSSFTATPTGYLAVSGLNPASDTEIYALHVTDSIPAKLAADLAEAVSEFNAGSYSGYSLSASSTDPTGRFGSGYNFYLTFSGSTLGAGAPYFGFDFSQLNGIGDTLSVDAVAGTAVPEPASLGVLALGGLGLLARRRSGGK